MLVGLGQKAAGAAAWIEDAILRGRSRHQHTKFDKFTRSEVLPRIASEIIALESLESDTLGIEVGFRKRQAFKVGNDGGNFRVGDFNFLIEDFRVALAVAFVETADAFAKREVVFAGGNLESVRLALVGVFFIGDFYED